MQQLAQNGYTDQDVRTALQKPVREWSFRYELLDVDNTKLRELNNVTSCSIDYNSLADIKRTAKFLIDDKEDIDFLSNRIKPYIRLKMPPKTGVENEYVEWPQGVFLLSTPVRNTTATDNILRDVEAYDQLLVYKDDKVGVRYSVDEGELYTDAISTLLGSIDVNLTPSTETLPTTLEWPPGSPKLKIINSLLTSINYNSLHFGPEGRAIIRPYRSPSNEPSEYTYANDQHSVMLPEVMQERDLFSIANKWILVVSEADQTPMVSTHTNDNPSSSTSTTNRGRTIVDFREEESASSQSTLDAKVLRLAFEASQIYEAIEFETGLMPFHGHSDIYTLAFSTLGLDAKFSEHTWSYELRAGAKMSHRARRVVTI